MQPTRWISVRYLIEADEPVTPVLGKKPAVPSSGPRSHPGLPALADLAREVADRVKQGKEGPGTSPQGSARVTARQAEIRKKREQEQAAATKKLQARKNARLSDVKPHDFSSHDAIEHDSPTLAQRTRPDLAHPKKVYQDFHDAYHHEDARTKSIDPAGHGIYGALRGQMESGHGYFAKHHVKHENDEHTFHHDADERAPRHNAVYMIASALGVNHMVVPGAGTKLHGDHQLPDDAKHHADKDAHVQMEAPNTVHLARASPAQLDKVDHEHRVMGAILHAVTMNVDGHANNVLLDKEHGHPILIDHDGSFSHAKQHRDHFAPIFGDERRNDSVFLDRDDEDGLHYTKTGERVGTNFPPRADKLLKILAHSDGEMGRNSLGLSEKDSEELRVVAEALHDHGLEDGLKELKATYY